MGIKTLINKVTEQIVHIELVDQFLAAVGDAENWIEHKAEELVELVAGNAAADPAPEQPVPADPVIEALNESPSEQPAVEIPAEAAAIAADPAQSA